MTSLDRNLKVECEAPQVGYISDPRFSPVSKASDRERKNRSSLIDLEDDTKSKNYSIDKPLPLEKLCNLSGALSLEVPPTPPKRGDAFMNKHAIKKLPIPTPVQKPPPPPPPPQKKQCQDKRQPLPSLPQQKSIPSLPLQANEGPSSKENMMVPSPSEKKPLTPVKVPATVQLPQKSFRLPLPVKESDTLPIQKAPVLPPRKGNTFPLPRKESAFKLPTPTRDKPLVNREPVSTIFSTKLNSTLSKSHLKLPLFKDDKDTLKTWKENGSKPQIISTDDEVNSKKDRFTFSRLKETRLKVLQGIHSNNMEANQQPFSPTKHQPPFSSFFNHNETETNTLRKDLLLFNSKDEDKVDHPKVNNDISSFDPRNNQNGSLVEEMVKTTYKGNNTTTKGGISSSLSLVSKSEGNGVASKKSTLDDQQKSPVNNGHSTPIKDVEPSIQACISKKEDDSNNGVLNTTESNTTLNKDDFKPPLPKQRPLKVDISILESPKQTNKNEDATSDALSGKKSIKHSLRLGIQTNDMSKEKLPKPTTVFNGIKTISSESSINATSPESNVSNVSDHTWPSSPKKEFLVVSPRIGSHQIKPHVFHRELPSPRGDKIKRVGPPPPLPKRPKPSSRPPTPKKDIYTSSNQNHAIAKNSDWRRRLDMPPPPLTINRDRFSHSTRAVSLRKDTLTRSLESKVPQLDDGAPQIPDDDEVPTPGGIKINLPLVPPKLPPKTFLPDIAPPLPPKKNILPPPVKIPHNPARHKELIPLPARLSLEEDYPNKTIEPNEVFHVEYRERNHFRGVQWCFDEFSGVYHKKIPGLEQNLPGSSKLQRSQSAILVKPRTQSRLSRHKEPIYPSNHDDVKWATPTSVHEVRLMRKESKKMRDKRAQLSLCRVLIEATADNKEFKTPFFTTKYSPKDLRKKKKDMVFDQVLVVEAQRLLKDLVMGRDFPDPEAQFLLANCYGVGGLGFPLDRERAFSLYHHASKQNHIEATYRTAVCYEMGIGTCQDNGRAITFYRKAATYSHISSMYKLGIILLRGYCGQTKNIREALTWLQRAASSSSENPHALHALAMLQLEEACPDTNLIADASYAIDLLHASARLNYVPSQVKLGELYEAGQVVNEDDALSIYWYSKAAQAGNPDAALALSCWYLTGANGILEQSDQEALLWAYKAATSKAADRWTVAKAMFLVGVYIEHGAASSHRDASAWFRRAAALGHKGAADKLKSKNVKGDSVY